MSRIKICYISTIIYAGRWIGKVFGEGGGEVYSCIIFICNYDPFGRGKAVYRFRYREDEEKDLYLEDGTYKIYLNTACAEEAIPDDMKNLFQYIRNMKVESGDDAGDTYPQECGKSQQRG